MKFASFQVRAACVVALLLLTNVPVATAQLRMPFRNTRNTGGRSAENVTLTQNSGPWLVMCASFSGDSAMRKAENLAEELRTKHRLRAYVYRQKFDFTEKLINSAITTWKVDESSGDGKVIPAEMKPATTSSFEEVAVMVGDFPTIEDSRAQKTLKLIKTLAADSIDASLAGAAESDLSAERIRQWRNNSQNSTAASVTSKGAFGAAFLLPNPLLPDEYFASLKVDDFIIGINRKLKHSLLKNPGVYTVRVASFQGDSTFDSEEIKRKDRELKWLAKNRKSVSSSRLAEASHKAHLLTEEFRKLGVDAYEFHDRNESYVCVGSFDWIVREDGGGNKTQNPEVVDVILKYKGKVRDFPGRPNSIQPYVLPSLAKKKIVCDAQPIPVAVPKVAKQSSASRLLKKFRR